MKKIILVLALLFVGFGYAQDPVYRLESKGPGRVLAITDTVNNIPKRYPDINIFADINAVGNVEIFLVEKPKVYVAIQFNGQRGIPYTQFIDGDNADATFASADAVTLWFDTNFNPPGGSGSSTVNVKSYGAKGDGTTDETAAILAANTYAIANNKVLVFEEKTYKVNGTIPFYRVEFNGAELVGTPKLTTSLDGARLSNVKVDFQDGDVTNFIEITTDDIKDVIIDGVYIEGVESSTYFQGVKILADNTENIHIKNVELNDCTVLKNGVIGDTNGSMRAVWVSAVSNVSSVNPTFSNSSIRNVKSINCFSIDELDAVVLEDVDTVHIQCNPSFILNSIVDEVYNYEGGKRALKLQCSGIKATNITHLVSNPTGEIATANQYQFAAVSCAGNNIAIDNVYSNTFRYALEFTAGASNCSAKNIYHFNSNTFAVNPVGAQNQFYSSIVFSINVNNITVSDVFVNLTSLGLTSSTTTNGAVSKKIRISNVYGTVGGGLAAFRDNTSEASATVEDVVLDNINLTVDSYFTDTPQIYFASANNVILRNSKITYTGRYYAFAKNKFKFRVENSTINDVSGTSASSLFETEGYFELENVNTTALKGVTFVSPSTGGIIKNIKGSSVASSVGVYPSGVSNVIIDGVSGFATSLYARGTTVNGIQLENYSGAISWYVNSLSTYTSAQLKIVKSKNYVQAAAPTVGTWARAEIVFNSAPSASGTVGWVCVTAGTPGTWKAFGTIAP